MMDFLFSVFVGLIILMLLPVWILFGAVIGIAYCFYAVGKSFIKLIKDDDSDDYY